MLNIRTVFQLTENEMRVDVKIRTLTLSLEILFRSFLFLH